MAEENPPAPVHPPTLVVHGIKPVLQYEGTMCNNLEAELEEHKQYAYFCGIPYAMSPAKEGRFQPPNSFKTNKKVWPCFSAPEVSLQTNRYGQVFGSEDCLYLNIYVPKDPKEIIVPYPVLVYFHGGGFERGSGNYGRMTPDSMMKQCIILVTVNYRLGPLGFLNMRTEKCAGNQGLKDQVMALKWVRDNIRPFGGDPGNVTISGQSAGGSCVNFHLISPLSKGLFHKAIVQSGGIYCPWGYMGHLRKMMSDFKKYKNLEHARREIVVDMYRLLPAETIMKIDNQIFLKDFQKHRLSAHIGPSVEAFQKGAFLPEEIEVLMEKAESNVPILAGITEQEGYQVYEAVSYESGQYASWMSSDLRFRDLLMINLKWSKETAEKHVKTFRHRYGLYYGGLLIGKLRENFATFCGDMWMSRFYKNFKFGGKTAKNLYIYKFDYRSELNDKIEYEGQELAPSHGDDINYLFCPAIWRAEHSPFTPEVQRKVNTMCNLWAQFCRLGVPKSSYEVVKWEPHTDDKPCYVHITNRGLKLINESLNEARWKFMNDIIESEPSFSSVSSTPATTPGSVQTKKNVDILEFFLSFLKVEFRTPSNTDSSASSTTTSGASTPSLPSSVWSLPVQQEPSESLVDVSKPGTSVPRPARPKFLSIPNLPKRARLEEVSRSSESEEDEQL